MDLACFDTEIEAVEGTSRPEGLDETGDGDCRGHARFNLSWRITLLAHDWTRSSVTLCPGRGARPSMTLDL